MKTFLPFMLLLGFGCSTNMDNPKSFNKQAREDVKKLVSSFLASEELMDKEKTISFLLNDPDFHIYADGGSYDYGQFTKLIRDIWWKDLSKIELKYDSIKTHVFTADNAFAFINVKETLTDTLGNAAHYNIEITFHGVKRNGEWKIAYAHAYHKSAD